MKRIVIACDGTWSRLDAAGRPTSRSSPRRCCRGRRTGCRRSSATSTASAAAAAPAGWRGRSTGRSAGRSGSGLEATLAEAYRFLVFAYAPGDEVQLFGFSRGAYTARSLAGLIRTSGILERGQAEAIPEALALYRARAGGRPDGAAALAFRAEHAAHVTTGPEEAAWRAARGLPPARRSASATSGSGTRSGRSGLPAHLGAGVAAEPRARLPRHRAVAGWSRRRGTRWRSTSGGGASRRRSGTTSTALNAAAAGAYAQRWFPGDHGAVGGGGPVTALSDEALLWVAEGGGGGGAGARPGGGRGVGARGATGAGRSRRGGRGCCGGC